LVKGGDVKVREKGPIGSEHIRGRGGGGRSIMKTDERGRFKGRRSRGIKGTEGAPGARRGTRATRQEQLKKRGDPK